MGDDTEDSKSRLIERYPVGIRKVLLAPVWQPDMHFYSVIPLTIKHCLAGPRPLKLTQMLSVYFYMPVSILRLQIMLVRLVVGFTATRVDVSNACYAIPSRYHILRRVRELDAHTPHGAVLFLDITPP